MHEVRTLKALQTGIEVALSKYLFYGQLGGQKGQYTKNIESGILCLEFCLSHFLSGGPLVPSGLLLFLLLLLLLYVYKVEYNVNFTVFFLNKDVQTAGLL